MIPGSAGHPSSQSTWELAWQGPQPPPHATASPDRPGTPGSNACTHSCCCCCCCCCCCLPPSPPTHPPTHPPSTTHACMHPPARPGIEAHLDPRVAQPDPPVLGLARVSQHIAQQPEQHLSSRSTVGVRGQLAHRQRQGLWGWRHGRVDSRLAPAAVLSQLGGAWLHCPGRRLQYRLLMGCCGLLW